MKRLATLQTLLGVSATAQAGLMSVTGPLSSAGTPAAIVAAPSDLLDDLVENTGMQGFDEAQGVMTTVAHGVDGGGSVPVGSIVDSHLIFRHLIFLSSTGTAQLSHAGVEWKFDGIVLGVMSDTLGQLDAASTFELGAPGTNYTVPTATSGEAAPFRLRGLESNDSYAIVDPYTIRVNMIVTEPGDWIRVVTATPTDVPAPASLALFGLGLLGLVRSRRRG